MSAGLLHSAQNLLAGLLGAFVVLILAGLGAAFGAIALIIAVGEDYRLMASIGFAVLFFTLALAGAWSLRHLARAKPRAFQASIAQLERDYETLKP